MSTIFETYSTAQLIGIALSIFLLGMAKGGFPIGAVALPVLVLIWPDEAGGAKQVAGFMLPILCLMDIIAVCVYRRHIRWKRILLLLPASTIGVALASVVFLFGDSAVHLSDRWLKLMIGSIGILFVLYQTCRKVILKKLEGTQPGWRAASGFGLTAGITSTIAHAGGPVAQMYFLPQDIPKMSLAASMAGFFFLLNLIKVVPYTASGQFSRDILLLGAMVLPIIPFGVLSGYLAVRVMKGGLYRGFIYLILLFTSCLLVFKALTAAA